MRYTPSRERVKVKNDVYLSVYSEVFFGLSRYLRKTGWPHGVSKTRTAEKRRTKPSKNEDSTGCLMKVQEKRENLYRYCNCVTHSETMGGYFYRLKDTWLLLGWGKEVNLRLTEKPNYSIVMAIRT
ncbi:hypothetical protein CEXT_195211 [Caerostris extrusa]|uniref:LAGLIDADG homing endonuclease n=1 Tax=Caerostris extrusa TaxID=172846 RepID=A0AAV4RFI1_CAEEX|nr:hypothetical protein CEXT_195211 [Caerostris extrusa]